MFYKGFKLANPIASVWTNLKEVDGYSVMKVNMWAKYKVLNEMVFDTGIPQRTLFLHTCQYIVNYLSDIK